MRWYLACILATIGLIAVTACTRPHAQREAPPPSGSSLTVEVHDADTGAPIAGAPVQVIGDPYIRTTGEDGRVVFAPRPEGVGSMVRIWTTPTGYSPGGAELRYSRLNDFAEILAVPEDAFTTPLIDPKAGGSYVFTDTVEGGKTRAFHLEIAVPPNALSEPAEIKMSWYPTWAAFSNGIPEDRVQLGIIRLALKDGHGNGMSDILASPITVKFRPYFTDGFTGIDPDDVKVALYSYKAHQFETIGSPSRVDRANELLEFDLPRLAIVSIHSAAR